MKKQGQWLLMAGVVLGMALSVAMWIVDLRLLLVVPVIPAFCLQLLMCRATKRRRVRAIPFACVVLYCLAGAVIWVFSTGWDGLLGVIMVLSSISPAVGCILGVGTAMILNEKHKIDG